MLRAFLSFYPNLDVFNGDGGADSSESVFILCLSALFGLFLGDALKAAFLKLTYYLDLSRFPVIKSIGFGFPPLFAFFFKKLALTFKFCLFSAELSPAPLLLLSSLDEAYFLIF